MKSRAPIPTHPVPPVGRAEFEQDIADIQADLETAEWDLRRVETSSPVCVAERLRYLRVGYRQVREIRELLERLEREFAEMFTPERNQSRRPALLGATDGSDERSIA